MMKSYRDIDTPNEHMLGEYLDEKFYSSDLFDGFQRFTSQADQILGKDIIVTSKKLNLNNAIIDEKNSAHYVNKDIPTFAFELSAITKGGKERKGWLIDQNLKTEYYLLIWPFADLVNANDKVPIFKKVTKAKVLLIQKKKLLEYLRSNGMRMNLLEFYSNEVRSQVTDQKQNENMKAKFKEKYNKKFWIQKSLGLAEKPINIVISRSELEKIAEYQATV